MSVASLADAWQQLSRLRVKRMCHPDKLLISNGKACILS